MSDDRLSLSQSRHHNMSNHQVSSMHKTLNHFIFFIMNKSGKNIMNMVTVYLKKKDICLISGNK